MDQIKDYLKQNKILSAVIGLVLAGFILYANTFANQMFWDDNDFILNNAYVHDWQYIPQYFSENIIAGAGFVSNYWRPVLLMVFSAEYHLWGAHPFGYHLVNLLIHIADALLLFWLLYNLFKNYKLALLTALLFLIHPLQTEAVSYVNSLGDSLSVFFILLGLNNFLYFKQSGDRSSFWWSVTCYPLALMTKETAIIYPALIVLVELFYNPPSFSSLLHWCIRLLKQIWPMLVLAAGYLLLRATALNFQNTFNLYNQDNLFTSHLSVRIFTFFQTLATYFGLLFYPHDLHMERAVPLVTNFFSQPVLIGFTLFVILLAFIIYFWKKQPVVSFGFLWFLIGLAPTSNILIPINGLLYEHWLYLPMIGFWLAVFGLFYSSNAVRSFFSSSHFVRIILFVFLISYFVFLSITTIKRNSEWHDPIRFYNQTLEYAPNSYRVINNLGMAYDDANQPEKAIEMYRRAIEIDPRVQVGFHNLGNAYRSLGQNELALENFTKAIDLDPGFYYSYNAIADIFLKQDRPDLAIAELKKIQDKYPDYSYAADLIERIKEHSK